MESNSVWYQLIITISISEKTNTCRTNISSGDNAFCLKFRHFGNAIIFLWINSRCYGYCDHFCDWWISRVDLAWLVASTVRLKVSDFSQLSDYTVRLYCPITLSDYTVRLHCPTTTVQNNQWKMKLHMHQ